MALNFADAPQDQGGTLIPDKTLSWGILHIEPKAAEFGKVLFSGNDNPQNRYIKYEVELTSAHVAGRKLFGMIGVEGSEKWVNQGMAAVRHILEVGKRAGPTNPQGYVIGAALADGDERMWMELDGCDVAVIVGIEPGKDGYKDKNRVGSFLSPHPDSPTNKHFVALTNGATIAETGRRSASAAAPQQPSFAPTAGAVAQPGATVATQPAGHSPMTRSSWTGNPPPAGNGAVAPTTGVKAPF